MSETSNKTRVPVTSVWLVPAVSAAVVAVAVISYGRSEERQAAAGSPYYGKAVQEAIRGLVNTGKAAEAPGARPALPAGLSPDEYYWCETCKAYHKRAADQGPAGGVSPQVAVQPAVPGVSPDVAPANEAMPPLPEGLSPDEYYWCVNCKAYHPKQAAQEAPAQWPGVPYRLPSQ